jgi:hypothetical protein
MSRKPTLIAIAYTNLLDASADRDLRSQLRATKEAGHAVGFVVTIALAYAQLDRDDFITQSEYARAMGVDERTVRRYWERFRAAFPSEHSPERLARWVLAQNVRNTRDAGSITPPPDLAFAA